MDDNRKEAIKNILTDLKRHLKIKEKEEIGKDVSFKEVNETIRKAPNGKAPGPDGIPNEFWKQEIKLQDQAKEKEKRQPCGDPIRPCIAALMMKVLQDVERFSPIDMRFTEARMGLYTKRKTEETYKTTDQ